MATTTKKKIKKKRNKNKKNLPGILLIVSTLLLGMLVIILVYKSRSETIVGAGADRKLSGSFPLPSELIEDDRKVYFAYMEIPDMIFTNMQGFSYVEGAPVSRDDLSYVKVLYWGTDDEPHQGELIVNKAIAEDVSDIFFQLYKASYPIERILRIDEFGGNDEVSMANNNTSCFNARKVKGSDEWSMHAYGLAIDINPLYNPYVGADGTILPVMAEEYTDRSTFFKMKIDDQDYAYKVFTEHGFTWGGDWNNTKDYQHFEKNIE